MTEPQVWTLIGVFAAVMLGAMTLMTTLIMRTITTSVGGLRGEMNSKFETVHEKFGARFESIETKFDAKFEMMNARFGAIDVKLEHLDRDVQALSQRVFNGDNK